jgi:hypothetical protein
LNRRLRFLRPRRGLFGVAGSEREQKAGGGSYVARTLLPIAHGGEGGARIYQEDAEDTGERFNDGAATGEEDGDMTKPNARWGASLDDFLGEEGIHASANAAVASRVVAWQLAQEMERQQAVVWVKPTGYP